MSEATNGGLPSSWTSRVLLFGTLISAVCFVAGFGLGLVKASDLSALASGAGIVSLLATPVVGLLASAAELRQLQRPAMLVALGVLAVLSLAVAVAILAR
jgi:hypothetical protein